MDIILLAWFWSSFNTKVRSGSALFALSRVFGEASLAISRTAFPTSLDGPCISKNSSRSAPLLGLRGTNKLEQMLIFLEMNSAKKNDPKIRWDIGARTLRDIAISSSHRADALLTTRITPELLKTTALDHSAMTPEWLFHSHCCLESPEQDRSVTASYRISQLIYKLHDTMHDS